MKLWIGMLCAVLLLAPGNRGKLLAQGEPDSHPAQEKANLPDGYKTAVFSAENTVCRSYTTGRLPQNSERDRRHVSDRSPAK